MSNTLELNCWVLGDDLSRVFLLKITSLEMVGVLRKAIRDKKKHAFENIDANSLCLWKVGHGYASPAFIVTIL
jgi:hypothetical protein